MEAVTPLRASRTDLQRLQDQLAQVQAFQVQMRAQQEADLAALAAAGRELRLDARRRLDSLERAQRALLTRADQAIVATRDLLGKAGRPALAVIAHRNAWLAGKLADGLAAEGGEVVAVVDDGADALGVVVAEQPDLLVLEDRLPSLTGLELVRQVRTYANRTVVAAQVESTPPADMVAAGASAVFGRRVPPATVAEKVGAFLRTCGEAEPATPLVLT